MPTSKYETSKDRYKKGRRMDDDNSGLSDKEFYAEVEEGDPVEDGTEWLENPLTSNT